MDPAEVSASHGETTIDFVWQRKLEKAIRDTKPAANLKEAVAPLAIFDEIYMEGVMAAIDGQGAVWRRRAIRSKVRVQSSTQLSA